MSNFETSLQILTIFLAFSGIFLASWTFVLKKKIDYTTLRARAFLNESFLMDVWSLLLITFLLFLIHAVLELNHIFMFFAIDMAVEVIIEEGTEMGILICTLLLVYKWFRLVKQAKFE